MSLITQSIPNHSTNQRKATSRIKTNFTILWCTFMLHRLEKWGVLESHEYHLLSSLQLRESSHGSPIEINGSYLKPWIGMRFSYTQKPKPESVCFTSLIHCKCFPEETGLKYFRTTSVNCIPGGASIRAPFKNPMHWIPLWSIISWHQIIWVQLTSLAIRHFINQPTTCKNSFVSLYSK